MNLTNISLLSSVITKNLFIALQNYLITNLTFLGLLFFEQQWVLSLKIIPEGGTCDRICQIHPC